MQNSDLNVLFVVWDSCRCDYADAHAEVFNEFAAENIRFENAIAPATWSLPSHASLFSGEYPSTHKSTKVTDRIDSTPLIQKLQEIGYTCYSVSSNGFASQRTGFHGPFDEAYYTGGEEQYLDALGIYSHVQTERLDHSPSTRELAYSTIRAALTHNQPLRSLVNLAAVGAGRAASKSDILQRVPHPVFSDSLGYNFSPEQHTAKVEEILRREANSEEPFFLFTNYMSTHRPYNPPPELQKKHLGEQLTRQEIVRLNRDVASPWGFIERLETAGVDERDLEKIRGLYAGEVETVDAYLNRMLETLEREGLRENTLVIVTSDHGENLGEVDEMGRRRMGHEASMSEHLLRVPLTIAHPALEAREIEDLVSLKDLFGLLTEGRDELVESEGEALDPLLSNDGVALSEYPAVGGEQLYEKHTDIPRETIDYRVTENAVAAYTDDWKLVADSTGEACAWHAQTERDIQDAPKSLRERSESHLLKLNELVDKDRELNEADLSQLEALGYL